MLVENCYAGQQVTWTMKGILYFGTIMLVYVTSKQCAVMVLGEPIPYVLDCSELSPAMIQPSTMTVSSPAVSWGDEITLVSERPTKSIPADDRYPHTCPRCAGACYIGLQEVEHSPGLDYCDLR